MKTRALVFVSVVGIAISGCATVGGILGVPGAGTSPHCDPSDKKCKVTINVTSCTNMYAIPYEVDVARGTKWTIEWTVTPNQYDFAADGITFKPGSQPPGGIFGRGSHNAPQKFVMEDDHRDASTSGKWGYDVKIVDPAGNACPTYDPTVWND
jgi:hypothetical protein